MKTSVLCVAFHVWTVLTIHIVPKGHFGEIRRRQPPAKSPFVKHLSSNTPAVPAASGEPGVKMTGDAMAERWKADEKRINEYWREHRDSAIDLSGYFTSKAVDAYDGKTVVENKGMGIIVETIRPGVFTAEDANKAAASGGATHGFFYRDTDFLLSAAKEYTALGENEVFRHRNINDVNFVRDTLDFFTNGSCSQADVNRMQDQMTAVVRELAQQIKDGGAPDLKKVKTTLTIGGAEVTISQLLEMQKTGRELSESFSGMTSGSLTAHNIEAFAEMGIAKSLSDYYGSDKGAIGQMFSQSMGRLYEKGMAQIEKGGAWARTVSHAAGTAGNRDAVKTELNIADLFSKLDTGSKSGLAQSFSSALTQARALVQQYCNQYGLLTSHVGLAGATDRITKFFQSWTDRL